MATDAEVFWEQLQALSVAESFLRSAYYPYVAELAALGAAPAWLVKRHNELSDALNNALLITFSWRKQALGDLTDPILVPRFVLADGSDVTPKADDVLLGRDDLRVLNVSRPAITQSEQLGVPVSQGGQPGQLGQAWVVPLVGLARTAITWGGVAWLSSNLSDAIRNYRMGDIAQAQAIQKFYEVELGRLKTMDEYIKGCQRASGIQGWDVKACMAAMPANLKQSFSAGPPTFPKDGGMGFWGWTATVAAGGVIVVGGIWLVRRWVRSSDQALERRGSRKSMERRSHASYDPDLIEVED
jgi:hypothetical protein